MLIRMSIIKYTAKKIWKQYLLSIFIAWVYGFKFNSLLFASSSSSFLYVSKWALGKYALFIIENFFIEMLLCFVNLIFSFESRNCAPLLIVTFFVLSRFFGTFNVLEDFNFLLSIEISLPFNRTVFLDFLLLFSLFSLNGNWYVKMYVWFCIY